MPLRPIQLAYLPWVGAVGGPRIAGEASPLLEDGRGKGDIVRSLLIWAFGEFWRPHGQTFILVWFSIHILLETEEASLTP